MLESERKRNGKYGKTYRVISKERASNGSSQKSFFKMDKRSRKLLMSNTETKNPGNAIWEKRGILHLTTQEFYIKISNTSWDSFYFAIIYEYFHYHLIIKTCMYLLKAFKVYYWTISNLFLATYKFSVWTEHNLFFHLHDLILVTIIWRLFNPCQYEGNEFLQPSHFENVWNQMSCFRNIFSMFQFRLLWVIVILLSHLWLLDSSLVCC